MASRKITTALAMRTAIDTFVNAVQDIADIDEIFIDSGYDAAGSNQSQTRT